VVENQSLKVLESVKARSIVKLIKRQIDFHNTIRVGSCFIYFLGLNRLPKIFANSYDFIRFNHYINTIKSINYTATNCA